MLGRTSFYPHTTLWNQLSEATCLRSPIQLAVKSPVWGWRVASGGGSSCKEAEGWSGVLLRRPQLTGKEELARDR